MPAGDPLNEGDNVVRFCSPSTCNNGVATAASFLPREHDKYLSCQWLEWIRGDGLLVEKLTALRDRIHGPGVGMKLSANTGLAVMSVDVVQALEAFGEPLKCTHEPVTGDEDAHSAIRWYPEDGPARLAVSDVLVEHVNHFEKLGPKV